MNELDSDEKILKIWAHNFENQKSYSDKKIRKARSQLTFNPRQIHELLILLKSEGGYLLPRRARSLMGTADSWLAHVPNTKDPGNERFR